MRRGLGFDMRTNSRPFPSDERENTVAGVREQKGMTGRNDQATHFSESLQR